MNKTIKYIIIEILSLMLVFVSIPVTSFAVEVSDIRVEIASADINDNILTVNLQATVPATEVDGKVYVISLKFKANDVDLINPAESYAVSPLNAKRGEVSWINSLHFASFVVGHSGINEAFEGGTLDYQIKFDVSSIDQSKDVTIEAFPGTKNIATWAGQLIAPEDPTLPITSYVIGTEGTSSQPIYVISPLEKTNNHGINVGDTFDVDVVVTADQAEANLGAVDAVLNYNPALVEPVGDAKTGVLTKNADISFNKDAASCRIFASGSEEPVTVGEDGAVVATCTFKALAAGEASFNISEDAKVGRNGYPADISATAGKQTVRIENMELVSNDTFKGAASGNQVLRYTALSLPAEGSAYYYGDAVLNLVKTTDNGQYVFEGFVADSLKADTLEPVTEKSGSFETVKHSGDVNGNNNVNAIDCLIAYDLSTGNQTYLADSGYTLLNAAARLEADTNCDDQVDSVDCRAIMNIALGRAS